MPHDVLTEERYIEATTLWLLGQFEAALQTLQRTDDGTTGDGKVRGRRPQAAGAPAGAAGGAAGAPPLRAAAAAPAGPAPPAHAPRPGPRPLQVANNLAVAQFYAAGDAQDPDALVAELIKVGPSWALGWGGARQAH
jgi:hypothetical protein